MHLRERPRRLDQAEYQKRYDGLTERFDKAKARLEAVMAEIQDAQTRRGSYETFLKSFEGLPNALTEFTPEVWNALADHVTVHLRDDIRVTFRNGQEVRALTILLPGRLPHLARHRQ